MAADTGTDAYAARLVALQGKGWKHRLRRIDPYRWNVRRLCQGRVLDVGCGIGRNLAHLDGRGVGVDHNAEAVRVARERGLQAVLPGELATAGVRPGDFDTMLVAHVLEHLDEADATTLMTDHLGWIRPGGKVVLLTPQERGPGLGPHPRPLPGRRRAGGPVRPHRAGGRVDPVVPLPRWAGRWWIYNETVVVARRP